MKKRYMAAIEALIQQNGLLIDTVLKIVNSPMPIVNIPTVWTYDCCGETGYCLNTGCPYKNVTMTTTNGRDL